MGAYRCPEHLLPQLWKGLSRNGALLGAVTGGDGVCRLQPVSPAELGSGAGLPLLPLKKLVLPAGDLLLSWQGGRYRPPIPSCTPFTVLGVAPCDLYALAALDRAFDDDALYQERRRRLLLVGAPCRPLAECACPPRDAPPLFDLFVADGCIWTGTARGEAALAPLSAALTPGRDESLPERYWTGVGPALPADLGERFARSRGAMLWGEAARRCLVCGACSAVCPTCGCYDVVDTVLPIGRSERRREWDNCFFSDHARVAGGHDFRPDRGARLRFRFEHKYLGFGPLRGAATCVGCGRCVRACPAGIDLAGVLAELTGGEEG